MKKQDIIKQNKERIAKLQEQKIKRKEDYLRTLKPDQNVQISFDRNRVDYPNTLFTQKEQRKIMEEEKMESMRKDEEKEKDFLEQSILDAEKTGDDVESFTNLAPLKPKLAKKIKIKQILPTEEQFFEKVNVKESLDKKEKVNTSEDVRMEELVEKTKNYKENIKQLNLKKEPLLTNYQLDKMTVKDRVEKIYVKDYQREGLKETMNKIDMGVDLFIYYMEGSKGTDIASWRTMQRKDEQAFKYVKENLVETIKIEFFIDEDPLVNTQRMVVPKVNQNVLMESLPNDHTFWNLKPYIKGPQVDSTFNICTQEESAMDNFILAWEIDNNKKLEKVKIGDVYRYTIEGPQLNLVEERNTMCRYYVSYKNMAYNLRFARYLKDYNNHVLMTSKSEGVREVVEEVMHLRDIMETYFYGNGSLDGQIGRFTACFEINQYRQDLCNKTKQGGIPVSDGEKKSFLKWLKPAWGFKSPEVDLDTFNVTEINAKIKQKYGVGAINITRSANAGICWVNGTKRNEVILQDLVLASMLIRDARDWQKFEFHNKWAFTYLAKLKPKDEIMPLDELKTKTRNFWEFCSFVFVGLQMALFLIMHQVETFSYKTKNRSLKGWSALKGGGDEIYRFIKEFKNDTKTWDYLIFCDNVYLLVKINNKIYWVSLDVKKAEASQSDYNIDFFFKFIKSIFKGAGKISEYWEGYLDYLAHLLKNHRSVYLANQFQGFGIPSGTMGTGDMNQFKTFNFIYHFLLRNVSPIINIEKDEPIFAKEWNEEVGNRRSQFKTVCCTDITSIFDQTAKHMTVFSFDLLGNDMLYYKYGGDETLISCLDKKRLDPAMCFFRPDYRKDDTKQELDLVLIDFVKARALYLVGGWAYPVTNNILRGYCNYLMKNMKRKVKDQLQLDTLTAIMEQAGLEQFISVQDLGSAKHFFTSGCAPSVSEALFISAGGDVSQNFITNVIEDREMLPYLGKFITAVDAADFVISKQMPIKIFESIFAASVLDPEYVKILFSEEEDMNIPVIIMNIITMRNLGEEEINRNGFDYENRDIKEKIDSDPMRGVKFLKKKKEDEEGAVRLIKEYVGFMEENPGMIKPIWKQAKGVMPITSYCGIIYKECLVYLSGILGQPLYLVRRTIPSLKISWINPTSLKIFNDRAFDKYEKTDQFSLDFISFKRTDHFREYEYKRTLFLEEWESKHFKPTKDFLKRTKRIYNDLAGQFDLAGWGDDDGSAMDYKKDFKEMIIQEDKKK